MLYRSDLHPEEERRPTHVVVIIMSLFFLFAINLQWRPLRTSASIAEFYPDMH